MSYQSGYYGCLVFSVLMLAVGGVSADVQVELEQAVDRDCDGVSEALGEPVPGACLIYTLHLLNTGTQAKSNLLVAAKVPEHTQLVTTYRHKGKVLDSSYLDTGANGEALLTINWSLLQVGSANQVDLSYQVRIE